MINNSERDGAWNFYLCGLAVAPATAQSEGCILTNAQSTWSTEGGKRFTLHVLPNDVSYTYILYL